MADYTATAVAGTVRVGFINDGPNKDVIVDYVQAGGTVLQSEMQAVNTALLVNGVCGGSFSELLNCNGYIEYAGSATASLFATAQPVVWEKNVPTLINIYPIPSSNGFLSLQFVGIPPASISIFDLTGKLVKNIAVNGKNFLKAETGLPRGIFILEAENKKERIVQKLIVQ